MTSTLTNFLINMNYDLYFEQALNAVAEYDPETQREILELTLDQIADDCGYHSFTELEDRLYNV